MKKLIVGVCLLATGGVVWADSAVKSVNTRTREEKVAIFRDRVFGRRPVERPAHLVFSEASPDCDMLDGAAVRRRIRISYGGPYGTNSFVVTAFLPKKQSPAPAFLLICNRKVAEYADPDRKVKSDFWPVEDLVSRGYAALMFHNGDVAPDLNVGCTQGVFACFEKTPKAYRSTQLWGTLSAWAWGASRVMDWIETELRIDRTRVAVVGHSRGGKTALWTAVTDTRFAYACVNNSGCSGAKLNHMDLPKSEKIVDIVKVFPYWFCMDYVTCVNRDRELDFDQHELLSCVAPRLLAVGSGEEDFWAGPAGERKATELAAEAWADKSRVKYHIRPGGHGLTQADWTAYMDHAKANGWECDYLPTSTPEAQGVSSAGIRKWIDACEKKLNALHGFVFLRHGKVIAEGYWKPYLQNERHRLYSHSKSFTSTAVGFLVEEGKLDIDERVSDIFPDKLPPNPSRNLLEMRVRDLLTMGTGSTKDSLWTVVDAADGDWVRAFFTHPVEKEPGTHFRYNSGATYMLSAIVEKRSGEKLMDYLERKLFRHIGITDAWSTTCPKGIACGGWGMNMRTRDLALFGQFCLQKGVWDGRRIMDDQWLARATAKQIENGTDKTKDWQQGYGYQFWRCRHNAYRADGARGQYTVVMPDLDAVVSVTASVDNMTEILDVIWENILPAIHPDALPENEREHAALLARCAALSLPTVKGIREGAADVLGKVYAFGDNKDGIGSVRLSRTQDGWDMVYETPLGTQRFPIGFGAWKYGCVTLQEKAFERPGAILGPQKVASSGAWTAPDTFICKTYMVGGPSELDFILRFSGAKLTVDIRQRAFSGRHITLSGTRK